MAHCSMPERERFERHFDVCPHCARYLAAVCARPSTLTGRLTVEDVDALQPEARDDLLRRVPHLPKLDPMR